MLEHSIPIGDVPCLPAFQPSEVHLFGACILAAVLQHGDGLALPRDVQFLPPKTGLGLLKKLFQGGSIHEAVYQRAGSNPAL